MKYIFSLLIFLGLFTSGCSSMDISVLAVYEKKVTLEKSENSLSKLDSALLHKDDLNPSGIFKGDIVPGFTFKGRVINENNIPLGIALISFGIIDKDNNVIFKDVKSNLDGNFIITNIASGVYRFAVFKDEYQFKVINEITLSENNSPLELNLILSK